MSSHGFRKIIAAPRKKRMSKAAELSFGKALSKGLGKKKPLKTLRSNFQNLRFKGKPKSKSFDKRVQDVLLKNSTANNSYIVQYADGQVIQGTTNNPANQLVWANNQTTYGGLAANSVNNLHIHEPRVLDLIAAAVLNQTTTEFFVRSCEVSDTITNCENSKCELWEYRVRARRDVTTSIDTMAKSGFADVGAGIGTSLTYVMVGATLFQNPRFVENFKILKVKKWILSPGEAKTIKYKDTRLRKFSRETFNPGGAGVKSILRGQTMSVFIAHGTAATNLTANAGFTIGIGTVRLVHVYKTRYNYSWVSDQQVNAGSAQLLPGFTYGTDWAPAPVVLNNPLSAINTNQVAAGNLSNIVLGTRVYDTNAVSDNAVQDAYQI